MRAPTVRNPSAGPWAAEPASAPPATAPVGVVPPAAQLRALDELVSLGYYRGIVRQLDAIEALDVAHGAFVGHLRGLAEGFQLDAMARVIRHALGDGPNAPSAPIAPAERFAGGPEAVARPHNPSP